MISVIDSICSAMSGAWHPCLAHLNLQSVRCLASCLRLADVLLCRRSCLLIRIIMDIYMKAMLYGFSCVIQPHTFLLRFCFFPCCKWSFQGIVRPDPFYVDQAINTLEHLIEMGIPAVCNSWLTLPPCPDIVSIDSLYSAASRWEQWLLKTRTMSN